MLEFRNLCAGYDGVQKLGSVNAKIEKGNITAIIGPNGCGKSTLMKCAAGLLKPADGEIRFNDMDLQAIAQRERARYISYMPQSRIVPEISVRQLVTHGRYPHLKWGQVLGGEDKRIISEAIERMQLTGIAGKSVSRLSGGERQRAYLAMMLAQQTPVMLLDEPTTYLDISSQFALMRLLQELRDEERSVAVVLHDLALALECADHILLMHRGKLLAAGSPEEIWHSGMLHQAFGVNAKRTADGKYVFYAGTEEEVI